MRLKIRYDGESKKFCKIFWELNKALAKRFQLHALSSRKKSGVVRAPKEVLHELQFFMELLHSGVCGAEFLEQCQTPPKCLCFRKLFACNNFI